MNKKADKNPVLKKEHFELLLEDINDKFNVIAEGYTLLNNKIDTKIDHLTDELHSTRDELIFLIKASVQHSEERLEKKIEDGDKAIIAYVGKRFDDVDKRFDGVDKRFDGVDKRFDGVDKRLDNVEKRLDNVEKRLDLTNQKLDDISNTVKTHADRLDEHDERFARLERKN